MSANAIAMSQSLNSAVAVIGIECSFVFGAPLPDSSLAGQEHGRTIAC
jgi:hypothetical protein